MLFGSSLGLLFWRASQSMVALGSMFIGFWSPFGMSLDFGCFVGARWMFGGLLSDPRWMFLGCSLDVPWALVEVGHPIFELAV